MLSGFCERTSQTFTKRTWPPVPASARAHASPALIVRIYEDEASGRLPGSLVQAACLGCELCCRCAGAIPHRILQQRRWRRAEADRGTLTCGCGTIEPKAEQKLGKFKSLQHSQRSMTWQNPDLTETPMCAFGSFPVNERCFIRKEHKCGKMFGPSKSCFIACPTNDDLEPILGLMSEKLSKVGIEPIIAVKERAYGQDIFCTKICGKIIESRFCIVILDDSIKGGNNIPNPNVYYEYGLMTALRKHIIPLQRENLELAFNIQSYDTIKYNNKNITVELDSAIRDAIRLTEVKEPEKIAEPMSDMFIHRRMELAGFEAQPYKSLSDIINDTGFEGFWNPEKDFIVFLGKVDNDKDLQVYIDDLSVAIYRLEKEAITELENLNNKNKSGFRLVYYSSEEFLKSISTIYIGFITKSVIDLDMFLKSVHMVLKDKERYKITCSHDDTIQFGEVPVDLARNACY